MEKGRSVRWILLVVLALPATIFAFLYLFTEQEFDRVPYQYDLVDNGDTVFHRIPDVVFTKLDGDTIRTADLAGKIVLIDFFTVREDSQKLTTVLHGNLNRTYKNVAWDEDPPFLFLSVSTGDNREELQAYQDSRPEADPAFWPVVTTSQEDLFTLGDAFQIPSFGRRQPGGIPFTAQTAALIDKKGFVRKYYVATDLQEERKLQEDLITLLRLEYPEDLE